jgi:hypothetical protein
VKVGGTELSREACGEGYKYTYTLDASTTKLLESIELVGSKTETIALYEKPSTRAIDMHGSGFNVTASNGSEYKVSGTGYAFTIRSNNASAFFLPQIKFNGLPSSFQVIELDVTNTTDEAVSMKLKIVSTDGISVSKDIGLTANTSRTTEVLNELSEGSEIASISIVFENQKEVDGEFITIGERTIEISGMRIK